MRYRERSLANSLCQTQDLHGSAVRIVMLVAAVCFSGSIAAAQLIPLPPDQIPGNEPASPAPAAPKAEPAKSSPAAQPISIATVAMQGVSLSGYTFVKDGRAIVGNNTSIGAGDSTAQVALTRGGSLNVCASTKIHLSTDTTTPGSGLMVALDRGAFEAHYTSGQYSDVVLTPDLRILVSPPGQADLSIRVGANGDTCVDNHGDHAPYVLASSLFDGGAYRVQPNQRVLFEHGSLRDVVDTEQEPCGCPPAQPLSVAEAGSTGAGAAKPGEKVAPSPAAAQNPFPLAESEGLKPPPALPTTPAVHSGQVHVEVSAPISYDANHPDALPPPPPVAAEPSSAAAASSAPIPVATSAIHMESAQAPPPTSKPKSHAGFFGHIGHFFKKLFGG